MPVPSLIPSRALSASELRRLPAEERDAVLAAAAAAAAKEYESDASLTAFEAFGEGDLHVDSSDAEPR
jgi:acyl-CoA reductase-like NAD-dependent aldehyde dehydrogenase